MNIHITCKAVPPGTGGTSNHRLVFTGPLWDEWDLTFCVHGEKLRWGCDDCDEHFDAHPHDKLNAEISHAPKGEST